MNWLFEAGFLAARRQAAGLLLVALILTLRDSAGADHSATLRWSFLVLAAAAAVWSEVDLRRTGTRIRSVTDALAAEGRQDERFELLAQLWLATTALAVLTLTPAPRLWVQLSSLLLPATFPHWMAGLSWSAIASVTLAFFGCNALAAHLSRRAQRRR